MQNTYTALTKQDGDWWFGWIEEIPGVNSQARTRRELIENLRSALREALEMNQAEADALRQTQGRTASPARGELFGP